MSPWWRDRLVIGLCPGRIIAARHERGFRRKASENQLLRFEVAAGSPNWTGALDALPDLLSRWARHRTDATVVLSNHFVRYAVLAWDAHLTSESEWLALARHRFESVYGKTASDWEIRVSAAGRRRPRLAAAMDGALLRSLDAVFSASGVALVSTQPYLMGAFNRLRRRLDDPSFWVVLHEPGRLVLGLVRRGCWQAIRSRHADANWSAQLADILDRETAMLELQDPCAEVIVLGHEAPGAPRFSQGTYRLRDVSIPPGPEPDARHMAMVLN